MKKRYCYLISSIFLMFLVFLFLAYAAAPDKWVECKNPANCTNADNKCLNIGDKCCKSTEKLKVNGVDYCCIGGVSYTWGTLPSNDICDGFDNDCNATTADGSGETAPNCGNQVGVCLGSKKSCGGASGWLTCTSANYGSNYESVESKCSDGLDNDCDGTTDCADTDCAGITGPTGTTCCQTAANCAQDDCKIEACTSNTCSYTNRLAGATDECSTCNACDAAGGNCAGITANDGKSCVDDCSYCNAGTCTNRLAGATDECSTCNACNTAGGNCAGISAETGKGCTADCSDCVSGTCTAVTENNDGTCNDDCTSCVSGSCDPRSQCSTAECSAGSYCNSLGGNCQTPDASSAVCLNCAPDQTTGSWTATNHEDAGKGFDANLFNSDAAACPASSCSDPTPGACACYDASGNAVTHKAALTTGSCCGNDISEYYKPDYYGPECTNNVNDCVWSTGDAQASNTGNKEYWCYLHEVYECITDANIGKKAGASAVCCAGTSTNKKWTGSPLAENQYSCADNLDNDCDGKIDCADTDCAGITGPTGTTCCQTAANCAQDDCKIEACTSNTCSYTNRLAGATDECSTCNACNTAGGNCAGITANDGKSCVDDCSYCNAGTCTNRLAGATDECSTCNACNTAGGNCAGISAETGKGCTADCSDCVSGACNPQTENNDGACNDDCTSCVTGSCAPRVQCSTAECSAGSYCDSLGGNCQAPDASSDVCLNCVTDQTTGSWTWVPPNHEDAGKGYNANLFNSDAAACPDSSCSDPTPGACACYDASGNAVTHKAALTTGSCCGNDISEYYKPDYYGPECTNNVNDCVWSTGDAQASNTGNKEYWCYLHEVYECITDANIGKKAGASAVCCAGTSTNKKWTGSPLAENQYSCADNLDNDCDGKIDCADTDCAGSVSGNVKSTKNENIDFARIDLTQGASVKRYTYTNTLGNYPYSSGYFPENNVLCGTYGIIASKAGYVSSTRPSIYLPPRGSITVDFIGSYALVPGTTCEDDCTYAEGNIIHKECHDINGCHFCDETAKEICNLAQPGWIRDYDETNEVECAEGCPRLKKKTKAIVTCEYENLIKLTKLIAYKGKLAKLVVVTCG